MNTDNLASSLREMIDAAIEARTGKTEAKREAARLHYSRHETVVRETLAQIGQLLPRPRMRPDPATPAVLEAFDKSWDALLKRLRCYVCGKRVYVGPKGVKPHKCGKRTAIGRKP